jgi:hypothetical protein
VSDYWPDPLTAIKVDLKEIIVIKIPHKIWIFLKKKLFRDPEKKSGSKKMIFLKTN